MMAHTSRQHEAPADEAEETSMSKKSRESNSRLFGTLATTGAVMLARKVVTFAWTRTTGKQPPTDPADPAVSVLQALIWAVVAGITVESTRVFATRAMARRPAPEARELESS
jgi:hypothetical protein